LLDWLSVQGFSIDQQASTARYASHYHWSCPEIVWTVSWSSDRSGSLKEVHAKVNESICMIAPGAIVQGETPVS